MTNDYKKYLEKWMEELADKVVTLEKEIIDIEKRKNISQASKDAMIEVRKDILEDTQMKLTILGDLKTTIELNNLIMKEQERAIENNKCLALANFMERKKNE